MKILPKIEILFVLFLVFVSGVRADTITLISGAGSSGSHANGALEYIGYSALNVPFFASTTPSTESTSKTTYAIGAGVWSAPIAGTSWVSNTPTAGTSCSGSQCDANGFYYYKTTFTAVGGNAGYEGSISVMADDTAEVILNAGTAEELMLVPFGFVGSDAHCADGKPNCSVVDVVSFINVSLFSGTNTLTIIDAQTGLNGAGVDFEANFNAAPEPSSLLLLGTGVLGLALTILRKRKASAPISSSL